MMLSDTPKFKVDDEVISFRGERARIIFVRAIARAGKSHRVSVRWANELQNPDLREYYEEVFEHYVDNG